jgi:toxin ParE1/3/4
MTIVWSPEAIDDLTALRAFIARDDPAAGQRVALHIIDNVETLLSQNPKMGRIGRVHGTRELVIARSPFIVPYSWKAKSSKSCGCFMARAAGRQSSEDVLFSIERASTVQTCQLA